MRAQLAKFWSSRKRRKTKSTGSGFEGASEWVKKKRIWFLGDYKVIFLLDSNKSTKIPVTNPSMIDS